MSLAHEVQMLSKCSLSTVSRFRAPRRALSAMVALSLLVVVDVAGAQESSSAAQPDAEAAQAAASLAAAIAAAKAEAADESSVEFEKPDDLASALNQLLQPGALAKDLLKLLTLDDSRNRMILSIGLGATVATVYEGDELAFSALRPEGLDDFSDGMSFIGQRVVLYPALAAAFFGGHALDKPGLARTAAQLTQALVLTDLVVTPIKLGIRRMRPDAYDELSFPSGHTAGAFAMATVLSHNYGKKAAIPAYAFATLMGISRIDQRRHFLSDVIAGAAIGIVAANVVNDRFSNERLRVHMVAARGGGTGIGFTLDF